MRTEQQTDLASRNVEAIHRQEDDQEVMMIRAQYPKILAAIAAEPWAIKPEALEQIVLIANRAHESPEILDAVSTREGLRLNNTQRVEVRDEKTAVIPISGPIFRHANMFTQISGATSIEVLAKDFQAAIDNDAIESVVLDVDSPGGQVTGISEMAAIIKAADKPVTAYVGGTSASAAYWLSSAADIIVISDTALLGSIGVVATVSTDKEKGIVKVISNQSPKKQQGSSPEGLGEVQGVVDKLANVFIGAVASNRSVSKKTVLANFGQGGLLVGAQAVEAGMADALGSLESVIVGTTDRQPKSESISMNENTILVSEINLEYIKASHPAIAQSLLAEGENTGKESYMAEGIVEGTKQERARILAVSELNLNGHEALVKTMMFDGTTAEAGAVKILAAEKEARSKTQSDIEADATDVSVNSSTEGDINLDTNNVDTNANLPLKERLQAEWNNDKELRAEFMDDFESYHSFKQAEEGGQVKMRLNVGSDN